MNQNFKYLNKEHFLYSYKEFSPRIHSSVFVGPGVKIVGNVEIGENSSIWHNSIVRGDVNWVKIGKMTNIQDLSMLHVTVNEFPLSIGNKVTIGHAVKLHGCTIEDLTLIGIGAVVLDGAIVKENSIVAAGSVVRPNFVVPSGVLVAGVPAKIVRYLTKDEIDYFEKSAQHYIDYTEITMQSFREQQNEN